MKVSVQKIQSFQGHKDSIFALSGDSNNSVFYTAGGDGIIAEWDIIKPEEGKMLAKIEGSVYSIYQSSLLNKLFIAQNQLGVHIIDLKNRNLEKTIKLDQCPYYALGLQNNVLFVGGGNGSIYLLDINTYALIKALPLSSKSCRAIAIHPTEPIIAAGFSDNSIKLISLKTHEVFPIDNAHASSVFCLSFSPDGTYLLSGGRDAQLCIWSSKDWSLHEKIAAHMYTINHIAYSPNGKHFATASKDKTVKIWDAEKFRLLRVIDKPRHGGHANSVNKLLWKTYKNNLISCGDDRTSMVWDLDFNNL